MGLVLNNQALQAGPHLEGRGVVSIKKEKGQKKLATEVQRQKWWLKIDVFCTVHCTANSS